MTSLPWTCSIGEPGVAEQSLEPVEVEPARQRVVLAPAAGRVDEGGPGLGELAGDGLGEDHREATGDEQGEGAARCEHGRDRTQGGLGVVDELEGAVAADQVDRGARQAPARGSRRRPGRAVTRSEMPASAGPAGERGERVRARVDDGDVVAGPGEGTATPPVPPPRSSTSRGRPSVARRSSATRSTAVTTSEGRVPACPGGRDSSGTGSSSGSGRAVRVWSCALTLVPRTSRARVPQLAWWATQRLIGHQRSRRHGHRARRRRPGGCRRRATA